MGPADGPDRLPGRVPDAGGVHVLDADAVRRWAVGATAALAEHRTALDTLNVFPVADSDTGTNLFLTLSDAAEALDALDPVAGTVQAVRAFTRGAVRGARGNSGVIVGQHLAVLCGHLSGRALTGPLLADGLDRAARAARDAVAHPVEGTVLTVARAVCDGAARAPHDAPAQVLAHALDEGYRALARTTAQLEALRAAGVRDAGAWGLLLVLEALGRALGIAVPARPEQPGRPARRERSAQDGASAAPAEPSAPATGCPAQDGGAFEVMYLVTRSPAPDDGGGRGMRDALDARDLAAELRTALDRLGDSVAVVGADGLWQAHVHTDDPFAAMAVPQRLGVRQEQVGVRHLPSQSGVHGDRRPDLGLVVVTSARGLVPDVARAGAVVMAGDGPPPAAALDRALDDTGAERVLVLSAPRLGEVRHHGGTGALRVEVLEGLWEVQVVVGAATFAAARSTGHVEDLLGEVAAAVARVRCAALDPTGDVAATVGGLVGPETTLLTVLTSQETPPDLVDAVAEAASRSRPGVELVVLPAGTPGRGLVLGAE